MVKELNNHAGRLASALGLFATLAVVSFSLGPLHEKTISLDPTAFGRLFSNPGATVGGLTLEVVAVVGLVGFTGLALIEVFGAVQDPAAFPLDSDSSMERLIRHKTLTINRASRFLGASFLALLLAWISLVIEPGSLLDVAVGVVATLGGIAAVVLVYFRTTAPTEIRSVKFESPKTLDTE